MDIQEVLERERRAWYLGMRAGVIIVLFVEAILGTSLFLIATLVSAWL